jgi:hypothetical protein
LVDDVIGRSWRLGTLCGISSYLGIGLGRGPGVGSFSKIGLLNEGESSDYHG